MAGRRCNLPRHLRIHWKTGILLLLSFAFFGCGGEKPENEAAIPAPPVAVDRTAPIDSSPVTEEAEKLTAAEQESGPPGDNTPPVMASVKLAPTLVFPGTRIKAQVEVSDPDGDLVMLDYKWTRNGAVLDGEVSDGLDTDAFQKGDFGRKGAGEKQGVTVDRHPESTAGNYLLAFGQAQRGEIYL
jgi:hypothetical protein